MKGFYIHVKNELLDPKHVEAMTGNSVWLFLWLIDKTTSVNENGIGHVYFGRPVTYEMVQEDLGIPVRTYRRYLDILRAAGYINTLRTPTGLVITVNKATKIFGQRYADNGTSPKQQIRSAKTGTSQKDKNGTSDSTVLAHRIGQSGTSKYNKSLNKTINNSADALMPTKAGVVDRKKLFNQIITKLGYSDKVLATEGRLRKLSVRLKTFTPEQMIQAAEKIAADPYLQGDNPGGKRYGTIDYLIRSDELVDRWLNAEQASSASFDKPMSREDLQKYV